MKNLLLLILILESLVCLSQTKQNEEQNINAIIKSKTISQEAITNLAADWRNFLIDYGTFPVLPYNEKNNEIEYTFINNYELNKEVIMNRILEWAALNFGALDAVLHYKNIESGKIILKGSFFIVHREDFINFWGNKKETLDTKECLQTYTFTVKNNKLKVQVNNISYDYTTSAYAVGSNYYPSRTIKFSMNTLYPITNYDKVKWKENLDILEQTGNRITRLTDNLDLYIKEYSNDYSF